MTNESLKEPPTGTVQENVDAFFTCPAIYSNRFFVSLGPGGVRIAFSEQNGADKEIIARTAVMLSLQDGIDLYKLMQRLLKDVEIALEKSKAEAVSKNGSPPL